MMTETQSEMTGVGRGAPKESIIPKKLNKKKSTSKHIKNDSTIFFFKWQKNILGSQGEKKITFREVTFKLIFLNRNNGCQKIVK